MAALPDYVKDFILGFQQSLEDGNLVQITNNYEINWTKLTDRYFKQSEWPTPDRIASLVDNDHTFMFLYEELYCRHLYSKLSKQLTIEHRLAAWENYTHFFDEILADKLPIELTLPVQWIWDIVDEFVYQYQEYCQFQGKIKDRTQEETVLLKQNPQVWNVVRVIKYLIQIINKSDIKNTLEREKNGLAADPSNPFAGNQFCQYLGYFSLISLCRLHCITGDYYMALKTIDPIELHKKKGRYTKVTAAYTTLYYYTGFAYMMVRRYQDSIKTFTAILLYISRMKQYHTRQYDQKKNDKMYALLAILQTFCPKKIDEHISNILRQEHPDKLQAMQNRETDQLFYYACPKFVSPAPPNFNEDFSVTLNATATQCKLFMKEINQQGPLPTIRSYLKLYSSIDLDKLGTLLERKVDKETLRTYLLRFIHKTRQLKWSSGLNPIQGRWSHSNYLHFSVDRDMIHVIDNAVRKKYAEVFLRNCNKLDEIILDLDKGTS